MTNHAQGNSDATTTRWYRLAACMLAMMAISNLQYAWTLFTIPLTQNLNASLKAVQWAFTFFVLAQTCLMPINAYPIDRFGARGVVSVASLLVGAGWVGAGLAKSLSGLYIAYAVGGLGAGAAYGACVSLAMKWFPDRRGLCVGAVAGCYGFGTALTGLPISHMIDSKGYASTFVAWGIIQGAVVLLAAQFMKMPAVDWRPVGWDAMRSERPSRVQQSSVDYRPLQMMKSAPFYIMYIMMTMVAFGGLMVTAQLKPIGHTYGLDKYILFGTVSALGLALVLDQVLNGFTRPFWGWVSDHIGRYNTMAVAFFLEGLAIIALSLLVARPLWFVVLSGLTFMAWGNIYSLFPSAIADLFGTKFATKNYAVQYTSKGLASFLAGPGAAWLVARSNSWIPVFRTAIICDFLAAGLALLWLKPLVTRLVNRQLSPTTATEIPAEVGT